MDDQRHADRARDWNALDPLPTAASQPVPTWGPPPRPPAGYAPGSSPEPGARRTAPWHQRPWGRAAMVVGAVCVVLVFAYLRSNRPERIDAQPAAPTPAGFQLVSVDEYQLAVPGSWRTHVLDDNSIDQLADSVDAGAPGAGDAIRDAADDGDFDGTKVAAIDVATGDNANLIPYRTLNGDPRDAETLAEIEQGFRDGRAGVVPASLSASPGDVHGFPAAVIRVTANLNGATVSLVSTIIQTGDRVFQLTVTSSSAPRAETLSTQIVPTFEPH